MNDEYLIAAKARQLGVRVDAVKHIIADRVLNDEWGVEPDIPSLLTTITSKDIERLRTMMY
jgi:hypothetical protein